MCCLCHATLQSITSASHATLAGTKLDLCTYATTGIVEKVNQLEKGTFPSAVTAAAYVRQYYVDAVANSKVCAWFYMHICMYMCMHVM